ncbi:hypothetical protein [[Mycoplasma] testudinis]|uniref:hypothetical protein n=1 Tax=[Mycoplasma] testudinis TaxID=33924 RepID=UPI000AA5532A|nr:hypothetical protein [[Mycoplasma] testudinis]
MTNKDKIILEKIIGVLEIVVDNIATPPDYLKHKRFDLLRDVENIRDELANLETSK